HFKFWSSKRQISKYQLLILNSYTSHFTREFIQFYNNHLIILFTTILYTTYIYQPLNVVYGKAVAKAFPNGYINFNKIEFLQALYIVRIDTFKSSTILSAWRKSGLIPFNLSVVVNQIRLPSKLQLATPLLETALIDNRLLKTPSNARMLETIVVLLVKDEGIQDKT
ncbi:hypothetical protein K432DRAFT_310649, partial [Lepidopterella palustris CBS 459.81]